MGNVDTTIEALASEFSEVLDRQDIDHDKTSRDERLTGLSMDVELPERNKLRAVFPQCFTDGKLDVHKLLNLCGEYVDDGFEKYEFRWMGKTNCFRLAGRRSTGTLLPCPDESVNWNTTRNLYIEGDNLEVLKLLQTSYFRKIKMIYIDPPYNTGNDFVYADDFADPISRYREVTQQTTKSNPETMGRFHTNWLNMMYPRLRLAANLLRDDGVIFMSIDDREVRNMRYLCDEIFGEENFVAQFIWHSRQNKDNRNLSGASIDHEYVICYSKQPGQRVLHGTERKTEQYANPDNDPRGPWTSANMVGLATEDARPNLHYDLVNPTTGVNYGCPPKGWRYDRKTMRRLIEKNGILWPESADGRPRRKAFLNELSETLPGVSSMLPEGMYTNTATKELRELFGGHCFDFPKPSKLIKEIVLQATQSDDIILDFFSGSATTAHAVMLINAEDRGHRRFIMVQLPEVCDDRSEAARSGYRTICEIGKERIRRAGAKLRSERDEQLKLDNQLQASLDVGFRVFKLDSSNMKAWDTKPPTGEDAASLVEQRLLDYLDVLVPGRTETDATYEVMLKLGLDLSDPVCDIGLPGHRTVVGVGLPVRLIVCLAPGITVHDVEIMADCEPTWIVFAEQCFGNSTSKAGVWLTLRDRGIGIRTI